MCGEEERDIMVGLRQREESCREIYHGHGGRGGMEDVGRRLRSTIVSCYDE